MARRLTKEQKLLAILIMMLKEVLEAIKKPTRKQKHKTQK